MRHGNLASMVRDAEAELWLYEQFGDGARSYVASPRRVFRQLSESAIAMYPLMADHPTPAEAAVNDAIMALADLPRHPYPAAVEILRHVRARLTGGTGGLDDQEKLDALGMLAVRVVRDVQRRRRFATAEKGLRLLVRIPGVARKVAASATTPLTMPPLLDALQAEVARADDGARLEALSQAVRAGRFA